jgi:hypothetical protein
MAARKKIHRSARAINPLRPTRDLSYLKPERFRDYLTVTELSRLLKKDYSWLLTLERAGRIPQAARVRQGRLMVRLWSPAQVEEIKEIMSKMRPGRPRKQ